MVGIAEGFALLFLGLVAGMFTAVGDVALVGTASFISHFALWALLNTIVAIHVDSRLKAIWWAIPFNIGYLESYYLCTAASFEGYPKSLVMPLLGMALVSPFFTYAVWMAKRDRGIFGKLLSILISGGVFTASYYLFGGYDLFSIVVCVIQLFVLLFWPARRLKFVPAKHPPAHLAQNSEKSASKNASEGSRRQTKKRRRLWGRKKSQEAPSKRRTSSKEDVATPDSSGQNDVQASSRPTSRGSSRRTTSRRTQRPTKRTGSTTRRNKGDRRERVANREQAMRRRAQRERQDDTYMGTRYSARGSVGRTGAGSSRVGRSDERYDVREITPLGTVRAARPSRRRG